MDDLSGRRQGRLCHRGVRGQGADEGDPHESEHLRAERWLPRNHPNLRPVGHRSKRVASKGVHRNERGPERHTSKRSDRGDLGARLSQRKVEEDVRRIVRTVDAGSTRGDTGSAARACSSGAGYRGPIRSARGASRARRDHRRRVLLRESLGVGASRRRWFEPVGRVRGRPARGGMARLRIDEGQSPTTYSSHSSSLSNCG